MPLGVAPIEPASAASRSRVTTHVLDAALGRPARGVPVRLEDAAGAVLGEAITDADGRAGRLGPDDLPAGAYRLVFDTDAYFAADARASFYPEVVIAFAIANPHEHYHVPVLLSPFAYSTYRGS
nr:hydroxyisourate hydrolase [Agromyces seonyuensis]